MTQRPLGQRGTFQARAALVGHMGSHHLDRRDSAILRAIRQCFFPPQTFRGIPPRCVQTSGQSRSGSVLGTPIAVGYPSGKIAFNGASGTAVLSFSASGPKAAGVVFLEAVKKDGAWAITRLTLKLDGHDGVIDLVNGAKNNST